MSDCAHHWIIDTAAGPTSRGVCDHCGCAQDFANSLPDDPEGRKQIRLNMRELKGRGKELAPLRKRFMELMRDGLTLEEIRGKPGFRDVSYSTLKTWKARGSTGRPRNLPAPVDPDSLEIDSISLRTDAPVDAVAPTGGMNVPLGPQAPQSMPPVLAALLELMPDPDANRQRHEDWLGAWDAAYTLLYLAYRPIKWNP